MKKNYSIAWILFRDLFLQRLVLFSQFCNGRKNEYFSDIQENEKMPQEFLVFLCELLLLFVKSAIILEHATMVRLY